MIHFLGLLYIIHTGINLPTKIDDWLRKYHYFIYMLIGTIYSTILLIYLYQPTEEEKKNGKINKNKHFIASAVGILLLYSWFNLLVMHKKKTKSK